MSTATKRDARSALADAESFRKLFTGCFLRWEFAGSLRRKRPDVNDVEHVVIAKWEELPSDDLFATPTRTNLLLRRADELISDLTIQRHIYGDTGFRWGPKYRGCDYRGYMHEIYCADESNWGGTLAIRTGSGEFSKRLVTGLLRAGRRNKDGYVWACEPCPLKRPGLHCGPGCHECQGTDLKAVEMLHAATEREYFDLCGIAWAEPENR